METPPATSACCPKAWPPAHSAAVRVQRHPLCRQEWLRTATSVSQTEVLRIVFLRQDLHCRDIAQLEWGCFQPPAEVIVWTDKRDKTCGRPTTKSHQDMLANLPVTSARFLFPKQRTILTDPQRRALLSMQFKRICSKLGKGKTFHGIRYTTISRWKKEGKTLEEIGRLVGHSNAETLARMSMFRPSPKV